MTVICETLRIGRATAYRPLTARATHYTKAADRAVAAQITTVVRERASYGYRRITAAVILAQLQQSIADYNHLAPHSALGMRSPIEYRRRQEISSD